MKTYTWTREEILLCIRLYCRLPYKKLRQSTPEIIELAHLLGRTPSAISMRCCNYVQFDPEESKRVKGFSNAAKLDSMIWDDISKDWEKFAEESEYLYGKYRNSSDNATLENKESDKMVLKENEFPVGDVKEQTVRVRIGQQFFRESVLAAYDYQCCITGIKNKSLLIASHIKPWKDSDPKTERLNPCNGLCLSPLYDKAFDNGLMTIDKDYCVVFSKLIYDCADKDTVQNFFKCYEGCKLNLPGRFCPEQDYLDYHRNKIFQF